VKKIILSQNFASLARILALAFQSSFREDSSIQKQWIFVPTHSLKQWLLLQMALCAPKGGVLGFQICTLEERLRSLCPEIPTRLELCCLVDQALASEKFFPVSPQGRKTVREQFSSLVFTYAWNGFCPQEGWQGQLCKELGVDQWLKAGVGKEVVHVFGFDFFPQAVRKWISAHESCFVYLFSPCALFWEDLCTVKEQGRILEFWQKKKVSFSELGQFEEYLAEAPLLLANWGKVGRETVKQFDGWDMESAHLVVSEESALEKLQNELLSFERSCGSGDKSIRVFKAGMTKREEVEWLCDEICQLQHTDVLVLAPDIAPYVPWIEMIFSQRNVPYRFPSVSVERQSPFFQGISYLMLCAERGLNEELLCSLLDNSSFARKWKGKQWHGWVEEIFQISSDWEQGIAVLLDRFLILAKGPKTDTLVFGEWDSFEEWIGLLQSLHTDVVALREETKTLVDWADTWAKVVEKYLYCDLSDEVDSFCQSAWNRRLIECRKVDARAPLDLVKEFLMKQIFRPVHGNHLHAIVCASIEVGSIVPAKVIFMLGMDEESFPRKSQRSSLNMLPPTTYVPEVPDIDRYLLLQVVMNAKEMLLFSYLGQSPEDGRSVSPSFLVQELCADRGIVIETVAKEDGACAVKKPLVFGSGDLPKNEEIHIPLSHLTLFAKHPWKYYLQNVLHITLPRENERSLAKERGMLLRSALEFPLETLRQEKWPGILHEAFISDVRSREEKRQTQMQNWGKEIRSVALLETAQEGEFAPLKIELEDGTVVQITGHIPWTLEDGALHLGDDTIGSMFQGWPEILVASCVLQSSQIYILKTGKVKTVENASQALQKFLTYYLRCKEHISPLISDWVDPLLRKTPQAFRDTFRYEDEVHRWVQFRLNLPEPAVLFEEWKWVRPMFSDLIALYPGRSDETV